MRYKLIPVLLCICINSLYLHAQVDTLAEKTMGEVTVSANKWEQKLNEIPNKIVKINKADVLRSNPQTTADLLGQTGTVFIQKSQLGGGSPMIRGFATNRVLLVVDGVRMNNAIYRSGNLQNVISIDPLSMETAEIIFGPGSLIYGSDAIGGVMDFHTLDARFSKTKKLISRGTAVGRYSTANKEKTIHGDINLGWQKWSLLSSISFSSFDDLKMGKHGGQDSYLRPEYIERIGNTDSIIKNPEPRVQVASGYNQLNFLQKARFKPSASWDMQYSYTYAKTGDAPRYDRLIQYHNGRLRFAEWYYGPMIWKMHVLHIMHSAKTKIYDDARFTLAYQDYEESRIDRTKGAITRNRQTEQVNAISGNWDATRAFSKGQFFYGLEYVHNKVRSFGEEIHINNNIVTPMVSRYPDGSTWRTAGVYGSYKYNIDPKLTLTTGLRYSHNRLASTFDTTFIRFPYQSAELKDGGVTGNAGLAFRPREDWQLNANISTGYRMPNVDDIGKLFESAPGNITVPNPELVSEYAWNFELGIIKHIPNKSRFEINAFYTILDNAITRRPTTFNGNDSILFNGVLSQVESLQNVAKATVAGLQVSAEIFFTSALSWQVHANWITGKETDDIKNEQVPLRHAPPFYGSSLFRYKKNKIFAEASVYYNSQVSNNNLAPSEQAKPYLYAKDSNGRPYSPSWFTLNLKGTYQVLENLQLSAGWENINNRRYRPYSSGIVAAGTNFIIGVRLIL